MALKLNVWFMLLMYIFSSLQILFGHAQPQVPCYFIFGDSLVDNGNNNLLITTARANYPPYGIDFPTGPTGRFSNGRNLADFLAKHLEFANPIPPFAFASTIGIGIGIGIGIHKGVNYGSGAAGIRDETGRQLGDRISMNEQLQNHKTIVSRLATLLGSKEKATKHLKTCIYTVGMGSNDYLNNYLMPENYNTSNQFTPTQYATALIQQYSQQLHTLYNYGARKIAIFGLGYIGCIPFFTAASGSCSTTANVASQLFDTALPPLVDSLNRNFTDAKFIYVNVTQISLTPPANSGITVIDAPCCIVSTTIAKGQCALGTIPCRNRTIYEFFDSFHPAEYATSLEAARAYTAQTPVDAYPMDVKSLAQLQL